MDVIFNVCSRSMLASFLLYAIMISSTLVVPPSSDICPEAYMCGSTTVTCNDTIPAVVSDTVTEVVIRDLSTEVLLQSPFCNVTWPAVTRLCLLYPESQYVFASEKVFDCLSQIQRLKFSNMLGILPITFYGLTNLTHLDLSNNKFDDMSLHNLLSISSNLPRLTHLNLSFHRHFMWSINQQFIDFLSIRPIQVLDLSHNSLLKFNFRNASELCKTLKKLILHDSTITYVDIPVSQCNSLLFVDLSGNEDLTNGLKICKYLVFYFPIALFFHAPQIRSDRLVTSDTGYYTKNCVVYFVDGSDSIRELHFSNNFIPNFEILFQLRSIEFIDLSYNNIKSINRKAMIGMSTLKKVDLSHNRLGQMGDTLSSLFFHNQNLSFVNLAFNELSHLPGDTFISSSHVTEIILTYNNFEQLSLNFTHLRELAVLDLRVNKLQFLDRQSMEQIDKLYLTQNGSHHLQILLEKNPFTCSCEALEFLRWFVTSPIYITSYTCHLDEAAIPMTEEAITAAEDDCERPIRRLRTILSSTLLSAFGLAVSIAAGIILYKRYKRRLEQQKLQDRLRLIQEDDTGFRFTAFLAYSSSDAEFVAEHIRQPLERHLRELTNVADKEHVCDGDLHFIPGHPVFPEMERCIAESAVFVAVISENFCKSFFCQSEITEAKNTGKPIILIFKEHVSEETMGPVVRNVFSNYVRAKIVQNGDEYQMNPGWEHICKAIIGQIKVEKETGDADGE